MKKCVFIVPYFGSFKNYFQLFLNSCAQNPNYDWLIITDNTVSYHYPANVKKIEITFEKLRNRIQKKFNFNIALNRPYKLCDFKPAFGYIFEDLIKDYEWWGHCDTDIIMGKLDDFITNDMLKKYDKLFCLGHFIMYKNNFKINRLFMRSIDGEFWYKESFMTNTITRFDEVWGNDTNVNKIFEYFKKNVYEKDLSLSFDPEKLLEFTRQTCFHVNNKFLFVNEKSNKNKLVVWNKGRLTRLSKKKKKLISNEYMYLHLQNRKMLLQDGVKNANCFSIIPNEFCLLNEKDINNNFRKIKKIQTRYFFLNLLQLDSIKSLYIGLKRKLVRLRNRYRK